MGTRHADRDFRIECLQDYVDQRMSAKEFAEHVGMNVNNAYRILAGEQWINTPRPDGFAYPWPEHAHMCRKRLDESRLPEFAEIMQRSVENSWGVRKTAAVMGIGNTTLTTVKRRLRETGLWDDSK